MKAPILFIIAISTPIVMAATLLGPAYAGFLGAAYVIYYQPGVINPLADKMTDVFYILDVYSKLFDYWLVQMKTVNLVHYTLPLLGMPLVGVLLALWLTIKLSRMMINLFHLSTQY